MVAPGHNEADTRAKLIDPALHQARWVESVTDAERGTHGEIHRERRRPNVLREMPCQRHRPSKPKGERSMRR
jgi:hypothetical protein